jgi:hypothetical protein
MFFFSCKTHRIHSDDTDVLRKKFAIFSYHVEGKAKSEPNREAYSSTLLAVSSQWILDFIFLEFIFSRVCNLKLQKKWFILIKDPQLTNRDYLNETNNAGY